MYTKKVSGSALFRTLLIPCLWGIVHALAALAGRPGGARHGRSTASRRYCWPALCCVMLAIGMTDIVHAQLTYSTSWLGNSFNGITAWNGSPPVNSLMQTFCSAIFVAPNGMVYTDACWDEAAYECCSYQNGTQVQVGGYTHGWGYSGGTAVTANSTYLYVAEEMTNSGSDPDQTTWPPSGTEWYGLTRRPLSNISTSAPFTGAKGGLGGTLSDSFLIVNTEPYGTAADITGLAADNTYLYVSNPYAGVIDEYNAGTMAFITSWSCPNCGQMAEDGSGNVWVIINGGTPEVLCYNSSGTLQSPSITFASGVVPYAIAYNASTSQMMVSDIGPDYNIKMYTISSLSGSPTTVNATFGAAGGIFSGAPGQMAPLKFSQPFGVGADGSGNIYVYNSCNFPGGGWLESYTAGGSRNWALYGLVFDDAAAADPATGVDVYGATTHYTVNYSAAPGQNWSLTGLTFDPFLYPDDFRSVDGGYSPCVQNVVDFLGAKFLLVSDTNGSYLAMYRFSPSSEGEVAIPCVVVCPCDYDLAQESDYYLQFSSVEPRNAGDWIWVDANGDGQMQSGEFQQSNPLSDEDDGILHDNSLALSVDSNGNIWEAGLGGIREFTCQGLNSYGVPQYNYTDSTTWATPSYFNYTNDQTPICRIFYNPSTDQLVLTGFNNSYPNSGGLPRIAGSVMACYDGWTANDGNVSPAWTTTIPYDGTWAGSTSGVTLAGNYVFTIAMGCNSSNDHQNHVYNLATGALVGDMTPNQSVVASPGWVDCEYALTACLLSNGNYAEFHSDCGYNNTIVELWYPDACATPTFNPTPGTYSSAQSVTISTATSGATIRYTTDGSTPTSNSGTIYSSAVSINSTAKLQAIAYETGSADNAVACGVYVINPQPPPTGLVAWYSGRNVPAGTTDMTCWNDGTANQFTATGTATFAPSVSVLNNMPAVYFNGAQTMLTENMSSAFSSSTGGMLFVLYYPNTSGPSYAYITQNNNSDTATYDYYSGDGDAYLNAFLNGTRTSQYPCAIPAGAALMEVESSPAGYQTWVNEVPGTGTPPSLQNWLAPTTFTLGGGSSGAADINGWVAEVLVYNNASDTAREGVEAYIKSLYGIGSVNPCAPPSFTPGPGAYATAQTVSINTTTSGETIRYTTDGTTPSSTVGTVYSSAVSIDSSTCTLQAVAYESSYTPSSVASGIYTISSCLPSPWENSDVGPVGSAGSSSYLNGTFTMKGAGANIFGSTDAFQYCYQQLSGNCTIIACVNSIQDTNAWAKVGVIMRDDLTAGGTNAFMYMTPSNGANCQFRTSENGNTYWAQQVTGLSVPYWVKIVRSGSNFTCYYSSNGTTWTQCGPTTSITMTDPIYVGLAVNSQDDPTLCTAAFNSVSVTSQCATPTFNPPAGTYSSAQTVSIGTMTNGATIYYTTNGSTPSSTCGTVYSSAVSINSSTCTLQAVAYESSYTPSSVASGIYTISSGLPSPWENSDVCPVGSAGSSSYLNGTFTVKGAGANIFGSTDAFQYCYQQLSGNCTIIACVNSIQDTNAWAKVGVMMRDDLTAGGTNAFMYMTPSNGANCQFRTSENGNTSWAQQVTGLSVPYWVEIVRSGSNFTCYYSSNGTTWTQCGPTTSLTMTDPIYVGLAVNSQDDPTLCAATFNSVSVTSQ